MFKEWISPKTSDEAVDVLVSKRAKIIAGGTGFYELVKRGMIPKVETIVDITNLGLNYVKESQTRLSIGATNTLSQLAQHDVLIRPAFQGLRESILKVKPIQVRNVATIGGAISLCLPFLDVPPALLALNAEVKIVSPMMERTIPIENFFLDYMLPDLRQGEIVTEIMIPKSEHPSGSSFLKLGRTESDFASVNVASLVTVGEDGFCDSIRVALGGVFRTPLRARKLEKRLLGKKLSEKTLAQAIHTLSELKLPSSVHSSSWYKHELSKVLVKESVMLAAERCLRNRAALRP